MRRIKRLVAGVVCATFACAFLVVDAEDKFPYMQG